MTDIAFEKIDTSSSGGRDAGYVTIMLILLLMLMLLLPMLMLIGGLLLLFSHAGIAVIVTGTVLIALIVLCYIRLLRTTPTLRYFPYFWLDEHGVHHIEGDSPNDRAAHFAWDEIEAAEPSAADDDFRGLVLRLKRPGMRGVPVLLTMDHGKEAAAAIRAILARAG